MAIFEFEGEVAGVVVDAEVFFEGLVIQVAFLAPGEEALEKGEGFFGVFEVAEGFGLEAEVEVLAGFFGEGRDGEGAGVEVGENEVFVRFEFLEGAGESGDGATGFLRTEAGDDGEELLGVNEAGGFGPVGLVNVFLHAGAVESAVGEAIDGEDVAVFGSQPVFEEIEVVVFQELKGRLGGEAEANREGFLAGNPVPNSQNIGFKNLESLRPTFSRVDIGAVGEVVAVKLHVGVLLEARSPAKGNMGTFTRVEGVQGPRCGRTGRDRPRDRSG